MEMTDEDPVCKKLKLNENTEEGLNNNNNTSTIPIKLPTLEEIHETDLPLLANTDEVHISHYLMNLRFSFPTQTVHGVLVVFTEPVVSSSSSMDNNLHDVHCPSKIVLDCCSIKVSRVSSLKNVCLNNLEGQNPTTLYKQLMLNWSLESESDGDISVEIENLNFTQEDKWSLEISGWTKTKFPSAIRIEYETVPSTPSLHWRPSQGVEYNDSNFPICYTPASPVNNRGIFPCQEPPTAMATWQVYLHLNTPYVGFLSSDKVGQIVEANDEYTVSYFNCSEILPMSTYAIFVTQTPPTNIIDVVKDGAVIFLDDKTSEIDKGSSSSVDPKCKNCAVKYANDSDCVQCAIKNRRGVELGIQNVRLIFQNKIDFDIPSVATYLVYLIVESRKILGQIPFQKLDIIIMPPAFPTLGLCNPNMIFLSQSLFAGEKSGSSLIYSRLAHELSHFWFGLSIGARDWTEEWLSEGFATFTEDIFHQRILTRLLNDCDDEDMERKSRLLTSLKELELMTCLRLITLQNELENTVESDEELQILCPNGNNSLSENIDSNNSTSTSSSAQSGNKVVINGLQPMKTFMQVHYLKGYFFLHNLCNLVSKEEFLKFLKSYASHFRGQLVTSQDFLEYFKLIFCNDSSEPAMLPGTSISSSQIDSLAYDWLEKSILPEPYSSVHVDVPQLILPEKLQTLFPHLADKLLKINLLTLSFNRLNDHDHDQGAGLLISIPTSEIESDSVMNEIQLNASEKVLLLEQLLSYRHTECDRLLNGNHKHRFISRLEKIIDPEKANPEILHRFCEIIVKFKCKEKVDTIESFLRNHLDMGIFIYGELMISEKRIFQNLARTLYRQLKHVLDPPAVQVLRKMIF